MRRILAAAATVLTLGLAAPAYAETYSFSGTLPAGAAGIGFDLTEPGLYLITWSSLAPILSGDITSRVVPGAASLRRIDHVRRPDGTDAGTIYNAVLGGPPGIPMTVGATTFSTTWNVNPITWAPCGNTQCPFPPDWTYGVQLLYHPVVTVVTDPAFAGQAYSLTVTQIDVAPVPEPTTWAMLIAGFGLIGAAMRRRRGLSLA